MISNFIEKIHLSILDLNVLDLKEKLEEFKYLGIKNIHLDVIDTTFSKNISFGPNFINNLLNLDFNFHVHFMIKNPLDLFNKINLKNINLKSIIVHSNFYEIKEYLKNNSYNNISLGIVINPSENISKDKLLYTNNILIMTVEPGFGQQKMKIDCLDKINQCKQFNVKVGIDGGVNKENINLLKDADYFIIGSALTKSENIKKTLKELYKAYYN